MSKLGKTLVVYGPMYAGKTKFLIEKFLELSKSFENFQESILLFRPLSSFRNNENSYLNSRANIKTENECNKVKKATEILEYLNDLENANKVEVIFIDEFQFFDDSLVLVIEEINKKGIDVIISGLDKDYRKKNFPRFEEIVKIANETLHLTSLCIVCQKVAKYSAKFIYDSTNKNHNKRFEVENGDIKYLPVCSQCHEKLKPLSNFNLDFANKNDNKGIKIAETSTTSDSSSLCFKHN